MIHTPKNSTKVSAEPRTSMGSRFFSSILLTGTMLLFILKPGISKGNEAVKKEMQKILKEHPAKVWEIQEAKQSENTINLIPNNDSIDPYDQIQSYVESQDMDYFNQLKNHIETKDQNEQIKCKAVVYAVLQDSVLTQDQKKVMSLALFEKLAKMPGSDYRFVKSNSALAKDNPKYVERYQRYSAYRSYLIGLDLDKKIQQLDEE
jgi:hypothetical protein